MQTIAQEKQAKKVAKKLEHAADYLRSLVYSSESEFESAKSAWTQLEDLRKGCK